MYRFALQNLSDTAVLQGIRAFRRGERLAIAHLIAYIAEADDRRLYISEACDSMLTYCERHLAMTTDEALRRIHAGRVARRFPRVFDMLADGRLHLTALNLLAQHLTTANADELLDAASGRSKRDIELQLKARFPETEPMPLVTRIQETPAETLAETPAPAHTATPATPAAGSVATPAAADAGSPRPEATRPPQPSPAPSAPAAPVSPAASTKSYAPERTMVNASHSAAMLRTRLAPHASERYTLQVAIDKDTYAALRECEALLGHTNGAEGLAPVLTRAIHHFAMHLKKRRFGIGANPARRVRSSSGARYVPMRVRRAVYERDGGRCTFTSDDGQRCESTRRLELDHVVPVARGGTSTVDNLRLRCRPHNHYEAERAFGATFMADRIEEARGGARDAAAAT